MEQMNIKLDPGTHNHDTQETDTDTLCFGGIKDKIEIQVKCEPVIKEEPNSDEECSELIDDTQVCDFLVCNKKIKYKSILHHEHFIKDDPGSYNKCSELIDYTQVCDSTSQSSDGVAMHIKEEPAADVGYDESAPLPLTDLDTVSVPPAFFEVEDCVDPLKILEIRSVQQQVVPSGCSTDDVCVSGCAFGNCVCPRQGNIKERVKCTASGDSYQCDVCHMCFSVKYKLQTHIIRTHTTDRTYKCDTFSKSFSTSIMNTHSHVRTVKKPYKCDICDKRFGYLSNLKSHTRTHTGEKPYECDICKKSYSQRNSLRYHKRTHNDEKPHKCGICNKRFGCITNLKSHTRTHTGEKPYKCDVCKKSFGFKSNLDYHARIHTGEKPYKCDICNKTFSQPGTLADHSNTHTGEKPYKCNICNKAFRRSSCLKNHNGTHTGEKRYKCHICEKRFRQFRSLYPHIQRCNADASRIHVITSQVTS